MKLWRLSRAAHVALDGAGPQRHGARYCSPGRPLVNFASEAGLAVLVALRYLPKDSRDWPGDFMLGWTEIDAVPERVPEFAEQDEIRKWVDCWLEAKHSLLAAITSRVLPEGDIVMMNPLHRDAVKVPALSLRRFDFSQCLHRPPMLDVYDVGAGPAGN